MTSGDPQSLGTVRKAENITLSGGSKEALGTQGPSRSKFFHFHVVLSTNFAK